MNRAARTVWLGRFEVVADDDQPTFWDRVASGTWEAGTFAALDAHVGPGTVVLDLGAWVGPISLYAAGLGARVVAAEADPAALDQLRRNLAANPDLAARVTVVPRAVAPLAGTVAFGARRKPGDSMSSILLAEAGRGWTAEAITPGELARLVEPAVRLFVKLDIEGGEYGLLPAMAPLLAHQYPVILVSFHPGILAEIGEPDPNGRLATALTPLSGWRAFAIGPGGPVDRGTVPDAVIWEPGVDTWLFRPR